jgi:hypothetical protein
MSTNNIIKVSLDVLKVAASVAVAVVGVEVGYAGTKMVENDADFVKAEYKYHKDPDPIKIKKGVGPFGKTKVVKVSPTGKVEDYTGSREPVNKKPIKVKSF